MPVAGIVGVGTGIGGRTVGVGVDLAQLGSQGAVCSGGRYDGLVEKVGGRATPAIGWALGLERLIELWRISAEVMPAGGPDVYVVAVGDAAAAAQSRRRGNLGGPVQTSGAALIEHEPWPRRRP